MKKLRAKNPGTRLLDPEFEYVPSGRTDIRKTFERLRNAQRKNDAEAKRVVTPIKRKLP